MYAYRQAHHQARNPHSKESKQNLQLNLNRPSLQPPKSNLTLASLANQFTNNNIRINCHQKITVVVDKINQRKLSALFSDRKKKRKIGILAGGGSGITLESCLEKYRSDQEPQYILTTTPHHHYQSFHPRGKSISSKTRTNSETSIGKYCSSSKLSDRTPSIFSNQNIEEGQDDRRLHAYASEKKISNDQMFVVEENASESIQSDSRESFQKKDSNRGEEKQSALKEQIKNNLNNITHNYLQKIRTNQHPNDQNKVSFQSDSKLPLLSLIKETSTQKENINEINHQENYQKKRMPQTSETALNDKSRQENPKFSFSQMMRKGLIQHESLKPKEESFKLVGDEQIQSDKKMAKQLRIPPCQFNELSEISSIISCTLKQETKKDLELESIKNQIEKISNCLPQARKSMAKDPIPPVENQRIQIDILNEQNEKKANQFVQISERPLEENRSEYFVRYNFKDKKGLQTDVIRISPLKFRKKEEVVKHFVKARIISKESDSINIP